MFLAIENGEVFTPEARGVATILIAGRSIISIGHLDAHALDALKTPRDSIDAAGCIVVPGFIDVHEHLLGGSGERGWQSETPEIAFSEIVSGGITTVIGCLGTNTITKTMEGLLAKAKALRAEGVSAFIWSGGYDIPPRTLT